MGITVNIKTGGLGRVSASTDKIGGLFLEVSTLPVDGGGWAENEVKRITSPSDLEQYGINGDTGTDDSYRLIYYHVKEVFRLCPDCTLYVQVALNANADPAKVIEAFHQASQDIRLIGTVYTTNTLEKSLVEDMESNLNTLLANEGHPMRCIFSAKKEAGDAIPDFTGDANTRVLVDISNDITVGSLPLAIYTGLGACGGVGTYLGMCLSQPVHVRPSWKSLNVNTTGVWETLGDVNGNSVEDKTTEEKKAYETHGVSLVLRESRLSGAFIGNSRTATDLSDDYFVLPYGRVIDKAIVFTYEALAPQVDSPVYIDTDTGFLTKETTERFRSIAYNAINANMVINRPQTEVSLDGNNQLPQDTVYIDPEQNVLVTGILNVQVKIRPVGASEEIVINIGLENPQS